MARYTFLLVRRVSSSKACWWMAILAPLVFLIGMVARYGYDAPFYDTWEFVPILEKSYSGTLTFADLWAAKLGHRLPIGYLIMLALARLSDWNLYWELYTTVVFAAALFAVAAYQIHSTDHTLSRSGLNWLIPLISVIVFSLNQWQIYIWGTCLSIYLCALSVLLGIVLLSRAHRHWMYVLAGGISGVIATYTFGAGMLVWPAGIVTLALVSPRFGKRTIGRFVVWTALGALCVGAYVYDNHPGVDRESGWNALDHPWRLAEFVFTYFGAPMMNLNESLAMYLGAVALTLGTALTVWALCRRPIEPRVIAPYVSMMAYALGCAVVTAFARVGIGRTCAMIPHYMPFSNLFWIGLILLLYVLAMTPTGKPPRRVGNCAYRIVMVLIVTLTALGAAYGSYCADERHDAFWPARNAMIADSKDDMLLRRLFPDVGRLREWRKFIVDHRLTVFRNTPPG